MNKKIILKYVSVIVVIMMLLTNLVYAYELQIDAKGSILIEAQTGRVLFENNADQALPPASVTKVMTMLLIMEAIDSGKISLSDSVCVSENAANMGGSQIYLEAGETMSVEDMLKAVVISSANDAAVALAEHLCGSEEAFIQMMNEKARELEMNNTNFENTNGLDDDTVNHVTSARDIAIMSRELIVNHPKILEYSSIWMDTVRNGEFTLSNTNKLIRFYNGANGLKTGSTSKAKFCISASAKRDNMQLIAVIMGSETKDIRNEAAKKLLDFGFSNYCYALFEKEDLEPITVIGGIDLVCDITYDDFSCVVDKGKEKDIEKNFILPENIAAPIKEGDIVGKVEYLLDGEIIGSVDIKASQSVEKIGYFGIINEIIKKNFQN